MCGRRVSACSVAVEAESGRLAGYCTSSAGGVPVNDLPQQLMRRLPRYLVVPVARLGWLVTCCAEHQNSQPAKGVKWQTHALTALKASC